MVYTRGSAAHQHQHHHPMVPLMLVPLLNPTATHHSLLLLLLLLLLPLSFACTHPPCTSIAASQPPSSSSHPLHSHLPVVSLAVGAFSCLIVVFVLLLALLSFFYRRWHHHSPNSPDKLPSFNILPSSSEASSMPPIRRFTAKELHVSTSNFCYQLGRKPNSSIFKGWIDGTPVAVKRVDAEKGGQDGFLASVYQASCVHHTNLVKLLGFCLERAEMLLVYEYLEAGSLDMVLLKNAEALDWDMRYGIATKVAQTLLFLHEECGECLVHGNVKLENIMLGDDWCPKLADFGLSDFCISDKIAALKQAKDWSIVNVSPRSANGSISSAWLSSFKALAAADVYGFGLVLLSLVLGRGNIVDALAASTDPVFLEWLYLQAKKGIYEDALDGRLLLEANPKEVHVVLQLAFCCMQHDASARPSIQRAWQVLQDREELGLPTLSSLALGPRTSTESGESSGDQDVHVLVLDVEKENGGEGQIEEIEPCYQVFSVRSHKRSASSISSV